MKLGAAQFLRDFRRDFNVKKTEAHRKRVIEKSKRKEQESSKVSITSIQEDTSDGRSVSKARLVALLTKIPAVFESRIYSKNELLELSKIYGISCRSSDTKAKISKQLVEKIMPVDMPMATVVHSESVQMVGTAHDGDSASNVMSLQSTEREVLGSVSPSPLRKRFKPTEQEISLMKNDRATGNHEKHAFQRAQQFGTSIIQILRWHDKNKQ